MACLDAGDGPWTEGELGQFLCPGDGIARLVLGYGEPLSATPEIMGENFKIQKSRNSDI